MNQSPKLNQSTYSVDPLTYNNYILTQNIAYLSSLPFYQFQAENDKLQHENNYLKCENNYLKYEIDNVKKQLLDNEEPLKCKRKNECGDKQSSKPFVETRYKMILFRPTPDCWSEEKIIETIRNIKSIDDIIQLDKYWYKLRHNITLQRLYHLIPTLIKLQKMVGLLDIKKDIFKKIIYYIQNPHNDEYLHTIISGPPGVGKTEFAKLYANIFVRLGILKSEKFIEIKRDDLVGQYLGQTSHQTRKLLDDAMDGVLFLDEAYSLGNQEKRDSFSKEAIDMINQYLSEKKGQFMFIIAGYEDELESCLFSYNRGMRRRFHSHYKIKGYEPIELREIFIHKINQTQFKIDVNMEILDKFFVDNKKYFKYFGGDIEKLLNEIKQCQSLRTFNSISKDKNIIFEDIEQSLKNLDEKEKEGLEPPYGMYL